MHRATSGRRSTLRLLTEYLLILFTAAILLISQLLLKVGLKGESLAISTPADLGRIVWQILTTPALLAGYGLSAISALLWLVLISRLQLSFAAPLLSGIYYLLLVAASTLILRESMTPWRVGGTLFVLIGVLLISRS